MTPARTFFIAALCGVAVGALPLGLSGDGFGFAKAYAKSENGGGNGNGGGMAMGAETAEGGIRQERLAG